MALLKSIRAKTIAYTLLIMLIPLIVLGSIGTLYYQGVIRQNIQNDYLEEARFVAGLTDNYMDSAVLFLERQSERNALLSAMEQKDANALDGQVEKINDASNLYYWVLALDTGGQVLASQPFGSVAGQNMSDICFVKEPLKTGSTYISPPLVLVANSRPTIYIGTPIARNGTIVGVLVGALDENQYVDLLARSQASVPAQAIYMVNKTGQIIYSRNMSNTTTGRNFTHVPAVQNVMRGEEGVGEFTTLDGSRWIAAYAPMPDPSYPWGVVVALPSAEAFSPIGRSMGIFLFILVTLAALATCMAIAVGNYIVHPITRIAAAVDRVAENGGFTGVDIGKYLPYDRDDELGNLARNFKYMSDRLAGAREKIMGEKKRADFYIDVMGHDINNLNQVILSNLELLVQTNRMDEAQNRFLEGAILATKDSANIVKNVRAIQKVTADSVELLNIDLDEQIRQCIDELPRPADKKVTIHYMPRKGMLVRAPPELKLAFCNVIGNSIKYSGAEVNIDITVSETVVDGRKCYVTAVADDGSGIPESIKQTLFARFQNDAVTAIPPGKGIGLYATKVLVEKSGGSIKVENRIPGDYRKGTVVTITLPATAEG